MGVNRSKILREAERFTQQGKIQQAIARFQTLLKDNPRDVSTVNKVGDLYARIGKIPEAVNQFMTTAEFYATDGFLLKAIAIYKKVTKLAPGNLDAFLKLGELYDQQGLPIEAKTQYRSIAEKLLQSGETDRAREVYGRILKIDPADVRTRILVADLQLQQGKREEALDHYTQVGEELRKLGKSEEYEKILEKALKADPSHGVVARSLAKLYCDKGEAPRAVSLARQVADARPQDEDAVVLLAETYLNAGSPAEAGQILDQAPAAIVAGSADLQAVRARVQLAQGHFEEAVEPMVAAVELFRKGERTEAAVALLQEWLETRPGQIEPLQLLFGLHRDRGEISLAAATVLQLTEALEKAGREAEAVPALEEIAKLDPDNAGVKEKLESLQGAVPAPEKKATARKQEAEPPPPPPTKKPPAGKAGSQGEESSEIAGEDFEGYYSDAGDNLLDATDSAVEEEVEDREFIQEHLTESEVFMKYRLIEKAEERLQEVLRRYPRNLEANERLRLLYQEEGDGEKLVRQAIRIADLHEKEGDRDQAIECLVQALRSHPDRTELNDRLRALGVDDSAGLLEEEFGPGAGSKPAVAPSPAEPEPEPLEEGSDLEIDLDLDEAPGAEEESVGETTVPAATPRPAAPVADVTEPERPLQERLREVDFFMEQELWDEARGLLEVMRIQEGDHPEVEKRWRELEERESDDDRGGLDPEEHSDIAMEVDRALGGAPPAPAKKKSGAGKKKKKPAASPAEPEGFFDLGSALQKEIREADQEGEGEEDEILKGIDVSQEGHSVEELFQAFRKGVEEQVEKGDYETHYQLGIAYKEMGLLDEAIGEFQYAAKDQKLFIDCCSILGLCFKEKGMIPLAIGWYQKALKTPGYQDEDYLGVRYDLALILNESGKKEEALQLLTEVYGINSNYRDVATLIRDLKKKG